jgi:hypothetical protein
MLKAHSFAGVLAAVIVITGREPESWSGAWGAPSGVGEELTRLALVERARAVRHRGSEFPYTRYTFRLNDSPLGTGLWGCAKRRGAQAIDRVRDRRGHGANRLSWARLVAAHHQHRHRLHPARLLRCVLTLRRFVLTLLRCVLTLPSCVFTLLRCVLTLLRRVLTLLRCVLTYSGVC